MIEDEESVVGSLPAPLKGDILFGPGAESQTNACIAQWDADWAYSVGFRRAALYLAEKVCECGSDQDNLIYPIVYLYRHNTELVLKAIMKSASRLLDRTISKPESKTLGRHDLWELWQMVRPLLDPVCERAGDPPFPAADMEGVESYIKQIHEHDPDGQRFRYATTAASKGARPAASKPSLSPDLRLVNVRILAVAMEKLADYLDGIESWFGDLEDAKRQWQHQHRD
ncbi:hypothetical protein [Acidiphilium acidophilum]|uniref:hypothetical protein n=1 Tax=Acidiphilium acidophilum TaxID=76588 RepID=UPI002E8E6B60|nr:hypothetical protein [Acidiphilium acidophilum]